MTNTEERADVVDVLTADHREVRQLIGDIHSAGDSERRRDLTDTVIAELVRHSVAEEMWVYPAMRDHLPNGAEAVEHDTAEHKELERTMKQLEAVEAESRFLELIGHLERVLDDHIRDEEGEQFPQLRAHLPRERLVELARKVGASFLLAPTRPHPAAPNAELFHKLVGPGVGLVDRLRDKLSNRATS